MNKEIAELKKGEISDLDPKWKDTITITGWLIGKSERTKITYKKVSKKFFEFHPRISIATATSAHVTVFLKDAENRGVKNSTLNLYLNALMSLFQSAVNQRRITQDPTSGLKNYRTESAVWKKTLTMEKIEQMLKKCPRRRDQLLIKILFYLGLRVSEVVSIQVCDFVFRKDCVILHIKGKGSKIRQAPLGEALWQEIENYTKTYELMPSDFLFSDEKDKKRKLSTFAIWKAVRAAAKRANIDPLPSPHWFRHTCATMALDGGAPVHLVQARLGHASLSTTQIYLHAKADEGLIDFLPHLGN